ncbi:MAG: isoprenylcysteine carboxylmethyltransferase family protein, partial [Gammaproteobacteria bacterium]|nr:isoprenylcysteine carboxylmethyltransferase family protein [Gammaproteobacteria bacterium]
MSDYSSSEQSPGFLSRFFVLIYGLIAYLGFLAAFLYFIAFAHDLLVPLSVSSGTSDNLFLSIVINTILMLLFGLQHTIMARKGFKDGLTRLIPEAAERPTYVMATNLILAVLYFYWQPIDTVIWSFTHDMMFYGIYAVCALGWGLALISTFALDHFELFGLKQIWCHYNNKPMTPPQFRQPLLYRLVRHPLQLGIFVGLWFTPHMTLGHLLFNTGMTIYILVGLYYE